MQLDVGHFRKRLEKLREEITHRLNSIERDIRHEGMTSDWKEQATERENDEVLESLGNASKDELAKVNRALKRIQQGEYFYCSVCGEDIPAERLELLPFSTSCVHCAEKQEH